MRDAHGASVTRLTHHLTQHSGAVIAPSNIVDHGPTYELDVGWQILVRQVPIALNIADRYALALAADKWPDCHRADAVLCRMQIPLRRLELATVVTLCRVCIVGIRVWYRSHSRRIRVVARRKTANPLPAAATRARASVRHLSFSARSARSCSERSRRRGLWPQ